MKTTLTLLGSLMISGCVGTLVIPENIIQDTPKAQSKEPVQTKTQSVAVKPTFSAPAETRTGTIEFEVPETIAVIIAERVVDERKPITTISKAHLPQDMIHSTVKREEDYHDSHLASHFLDFSGDISIPYGFSEYNRTTETFGNSGFAYSLVSVKNEFNQGLYSNYAGIINADVGEPVSHTDINASWLGNITMQGEDHYFNNNAVFHIDFLRGTINAEATYGVDEIWSRCTYNNGLTHQKRPGHCPDYADGQPDTYRTNHKIIVQAFFGSNRSHEQNLPQGQISGNVRLAHHEVNIFTDEVSKRNRNSHYNDNLIGVIGSKGLVGIFIAEGEYEGHANSYSGGFIATP